MELAQATVKHDRYCEAGFGVMLLARKAQTVQYIHTNYDIPLSLVACTVIVSDSVFDDWLVNGGRVFVVIASGSFIGTVALFASSNIASTKSAIYVIALNMPPVFIFYVKKT